MISIQYENYENHGNFRLSLLLGIGMFVIAIFSLPKIRLLLTGDAETSLVSKLFPTDASDYLTQLNMEDVRLFSQPEWGGNLLWQHHPQMSVFIDGRVEQFPLVIWENYYHIINAGPLWLERLREHKVDYLILNKSKHSRLIPRVKEASLICPI